MQPDRFAEKKYPITAGRRATAVGIHSRLAGYEDVNDSKRLSQLRPSGRDTVMEETKRFAGIDVAKAQLDMAIRPNGESFLGLRGYGRMLAGSGWASSEASEQSCLAVSCARRREPSDSQ
jgi:hypothetical protein